jgi:hypothetical protein
MNATHIDAHSIFEDGSLITNLDTLARHFTALQTRHPGVAVDR